MANNEFSPRQLAQLKAVFATKDDLARFATKEDLALLATTAEIPTVDQIRGIVKQEVRNEVASQLVPVHEKLDEIRGEARDDSDVLARQDIEYGRRLTRIEKHLGLKPLPVR